MGIIVSVLRSFHQYEDADGNWLEINDSTNGGITNVETGVHKLTIINAEGPFEPDEKAPAAVIALTPFGNAKIVPADDPKGTGVMFGGNYAATSDSRFNEAIKKMTGQDFYGAVPIHDRKEW
jgi:hypothetical protein